MKKLVHWCIACVFSLLLAACGILEVGMETDLNSSPVGSPTAKQTLVTTTFSVTNPTITQPIGTPQPTATQPATKTRQAYPEVEPSRIPTQEPGTTASWIVFTGKDENIWLVNSATGENLPVTKDAVSLKAGEQRGESGNG